jgi:hypothetical protein
MMQAINRHKPPEEFDPKRKARIGVPQTGGAIDKAGAGWLA